MRECEYDYLVGVLWRSAFVWYGCSTAVVVLSWVILAYGLGELPFWFGVSCGLLTLCWAACLTVPDACFWCSKRRARKRRPLAIAREVLLNPQAAHRADILLVRAHLEQNNR